MPARRGVVWLVGVAGSGKSTVGPLLAARLACTFVDLDRQIARAAGQEIAALFALEGEASFRKREQQALAELLAEPPSPRVVACGSGVVDRAGNAELMTKAGHVLWLDLPLADALQRCRRQGGQRPLMQDEAAYRRRLQKRLPLYRALGLRVDAAGSADEVARRALLILGPDPD